LNGFSIIMRYFKVLPLLPEKGGEIFGQIRSEFQKKTGISDSALKKHTIDMILASEAICHGMIFVYNDKIYEKLAEISELKIEKWID